MFQVLTVVVLLSIASAGLPLDKSMVWTLSKTLTRLSKLRWFPPLVCGCSAVGLAVVVTAMTGVPVPAVHDEFAYLLSADTFGHGRLTNPTHPFWQHFESNHIFHTPSYQAKYPPAQGLFLAAGTKLFGHPIAGVWLSLGLGTAAVSWALQGWLPGRWALLGGLLVALNPMVACRWGNTYWGGAVAMLGGALVYGGTMRLLNRPRWQAAVSMGAGLAILANSRPFEGLIVSLPALLMVGRAVLLRADLTWRVRWLTIVLPLALILIPTGAFMAHYNARLTGSPFRLPYLNHEEQYAVAPSFLWQPLRPVPVYRHESLRRVHQDWECAPYLEQTESWLTLAQFCVEKAKILWSFFLGPILSLPLVALAAAMSRWRVRLVVGALGLLLTGLLFHTYMWPHYAAPATVLVMAAVVHSLRSLRTWRIRDWPAGRFLVRGTVLIYLAALPQFLWTHHDDFAPFRDPIRLRECFLTQDQRYLTASAVWRDQIIRDLDALDGTHLVIVSYGPRHDPLFEWVYNEADIDAAGVVWAHDMGPAANAKLAAHFRHRQLWNLRVEEGVPQLIRRNRRTRNPSLIDAGRRTVPPTSVSKETP